MGAENYEEAARLRDEIRRVESVPSKGAKSGVSTGRGGEDAPGPVPDAGAL